MSAIESARNSSIMRNQMSEVNSLIRKRASAYEISNMFKEQKLY